MMKIVMAALCAALPVTAQAQGYYTYGAPYGSYAAQQNQILEQQQRMIQRQQQMQRQMQQQQDMQQGYQDGGAGQFATCGMGGSYTYQQACQRARSNYMMNRSQQNNGGMDMPGMGG